MSCCVLGALASSRRSVSRLGRNAKNAARKNKKKARKRKRKERLWANLSRSGIPGSGIPSDRSILTAFFVALERY